MLPKISVIVPIYNVELYIRECVDSILGQTLQDIEIILVDDGSPDNCPQICDEYAQNDSRVKVIHKENGGYGSAINAGFAAATGEYIGIVESDDWIDINMYKLLYQKAISTGADIVKGCYYKFNNITKEKKVDKLLQDLAKRDDTFELKEYPQILLCFASIWSCIYKSTWLKGHNISVVTDIKPYEDQPFLAETFSLAKKIAFEKNAYYFYRCEVETSTTKTCKPTIKNYLKQKEKLRTILINNQAFTKDIMEYYWLGAYIGCVDWFNKPNNCYKKDFFKIMKNLLKQSYYDNCSFKYFNLQQKDDFKRILSNPYFIYVNSNRIKKIPKYLFSITNNSTHKVITIMGIQIKFKRNDNSQNEQIMNSLVDIKKQLSMLSNINNLLRITTCSTNIPKANGQLRIQQIASLALLKKLIPFLEKNDIKYWIDFGTLLGAYRHKGFIPWDDDIDIAVCRKDYEKLKNILRDFCCNECIYSIGELIRVFYKNTSAQVDIFPYDSGYQVEIPDLCEYKRITTRLDQLFKALPIDCTNFKVSSLPKNIIDKFEEVNRTEILQNKPAIEKGFMYLAHHCLGWKRVLYEYNDIFPLSEIEFEGQRFKCPNNVKKHLHAYWGDYMQLPQNCSSHHNNVMKAMADYNNILDMIQLIEQEDLSL